MRNTNILFSAPSSLFLFGNMDVSPIIHRMWHSKIGPYCWQDATEYSTIKKVNLLRKLTLRVPLRELG